MQRINFTKEMTNARLKIFSIILLLLFCVSVFCAFSPPTYRFYYDDLTNDVLFVELINYENAEKTDVKNEAQIKPFDFSKETRVKLLAFEKNDAFFTELSSVNFYGSRSFPSAPAGDCIKLNYKDGSFFVIFCDVQKDEKQARVYYSGAIKYSSDGVAQKQYSYIARLSRYMDLAEKYFNVFYEI